MYVCIPRPTTIHVLVCFPAQCSAVQCSASICYNTCVSTFLQGPSHDQTSTNAPVPLNVTLLWDRQQYPSHLAGRSRIELLIRLAREDRSVNIATREGISNKRRLGFLFISSKQQEYHRSIGVISRRGSTWYFQMRTAKSAFVYLFTIRLEQCSRPVTSPTTYPLSYSHARGSAQ